MTPNRGHPPPATPEQLQGQTRALLGLARTLARDDASCEDAVQDAWVASLSSRSRPRVALPAWLAGAVRNLVRQERRARARRGRRERAVARAEATRSTADAVERLESLRRVVDAVAGLREPYRMVVVWRFFDDLSVREIAGRLGAPEATVRTRLRRALDELRGRLDRELGGRSAWAAPLGAWATSRGLLKGTMVMGAKTIAVAAGAACLGALYLLWGSGGTPDRMPAPGAADPGPAAAPVAVGDEGAPPSGAGDAARAGVAARTAVEAGAPTGGAARADRIVIEGTVRDADGRPIEGAGVFTTGDRTRTDAAGRFRFEARRFDSMQLVYAGAPGYATKRAVASSTGMDVIEVDFGLPRAFTVRGRVFGPDGEPFAGAAVTSFYNNAGEVRSGADGSYALDRLDPGRPTHSVFARAEGLIDARADVSTEGDEVVQDLRLAAGAAVAGVVVAADGTPIQGAELFIGFSPNAYDRLDAKTDAEGTFEFACVGPGAQTLVVQHPDHAVDMRSIDVPEAPGNMVDLRIELAAGHVLAGHIVDANGSPLEGVMLRLEYGGMWIERRMTTGADGAFRLEAVPGPEVVIRLYKEGYLRARETSAVDRLDAVLVLTRAAGLAGRVVDARSGLPVEEFRVRVWPNEPEPGEPKPNGIGATWVREGHTFKDAGGRWTTEGESLVPRAAYRVEVVADGYAPATVARALARIDPMADALSIGLLPGTEVVGQVVDRASGEPVEGAVIKVVRPDRPLALDSDDVHDRRIARTDADGRFALEQLASGSVQLAVEHPDFAFALHGPVEIAPGAARLEEVIRLRSGRAVRGRVLDRDAQPVAGAVVELSAAQVDGLPEFVRRVGTGAQGGFAFEHLADGVYEIAHEVEDAGQMLEIAARYVAVRGADRTVELGRPAGSSAVVGRIALRGEGELPDVLRVIAKPTKQPAAWEDRFPGVETVARNGRFSFAGLPAGRYELTSRTMLNRNRDHATGSATVDLGAGEVAEVELEVEIVRSR